MGVWWLYLLNKFSSYESFASIPTPEKLDKIIVWEGATFIVFILLLSGTLLFYYLKDQNKTKALQVFFAGLTHELKTPLASIRLQADVISDLTNNEEQQSKLHKLALRMVQDTQKLEIQMDKILQLSRIELGGELNPVKIDIKKFFESNIKFWQDLFEIEINYKDPVDFIYADEFALELIFKNLFENTKNHTDCKKVTIEISKQEEMVLVTYQDLGVFLGDNQKIGTLFYKFNSSKGSGIGLYLCKRLMEKMGGSIKIMTSPSMVSHLTFRGQGFE